MYTISKLCREFNLSRSTLLYYDSIGLLKAFKRTTSNYRIYSEPDRIRLEQICLYREAGVSLEQIKELLASDGKEDENVLQKRLAEINHELYLLRLQQKIIVEMLRSKSKSDEALMLDEKQFVSLLKSSGISNHAMNQLHAEFEKNSPKEHQAFLEFLGLDQKDILYIRHCAGTEIENPND
jgi:DNA-binding transcriptional MerR regulator